MKSVKKFLIIFIVIIAVLFIAFGIFVSNYYHALSYDYAEKENIMKAEYKNFIIYGDTNSEMGMIFYPGAKVEAKAYEPLLCEIAKDGIVCVLAKMPFNLAILNVNAADKIMKQITTVKKWCISGHSLGGAIASIYVSKNTSKINGLILLGAYSTKQIDDVPTLSIYGQNDKILNMTKYQENKKLIPKLQEIVIEGGNHSYFGNYGEQKGDGVAAITPEKQWQKTADMIYEFLVKEKI